MNFWNSIRKIEKIRLYAALLIVGVFFIILSCIALSQPEKEWLRAQGVIQRIETYTDINEESQIRVLVSYTDDAGSLHDNVEYPSYSSSMKEGDIINVLYDAAAPEHIKSFDDKFIPYIILAVGVIALAAFVIKITTAIQRGVKGEKAPNTGSPFEDPVDMSDPVRSEQVRSSTEPTMELYFHWTGKLNQSYVLETHERRAVYEAICDHMGIFTPYRYTFADRRNGKTCEHTITHTSTTRLGRGAEHANVSIVAYSSFKIDGENIWEYLGRNGYSVRQKWTGLKQDFEVLHYDVPVASLETAGTGILNDCPHGKLGDKLPTNGLFKVSCKDSDVEAVFMACFCVSRVEFF